MNGEIRIHDAEPLEPRGGLIGRADTLTEVGPPLPSHALALAFSPTGTRWPSPPREAASGNYESGTWRVRSAINGHQAEVDAIAFGPGSDVLATGDVSGRVRLWAIPTGRALRDFHAHKAAVRADRHFTERTPDCNGLR